ncbi:hypothetical protein [Prosthecomicrobium sp. N25]|uniref:hypothetical protein n=1 Tax=Prosthecomicrobium sp. N25 TaxID=3129254 RepID=UPI003077A7F4
MSLDPMEAWCRLFSYPACSSMSIVDSLTAGAIAALAAAAFVQAALILVRWHQGRTSGVRQKRSAETGPLRGLDVSQSLPGVERHRSTTESTRGRSPIVLR